MDGVVNRTQSLSVHSRRTNLDLCNFKVGDEGKANLRIFDVPNGIEGEHVVAGWPSWLTSVAREAVEGWLPKKVESFQKLNKIGQGTYSCVYKAMDLEFGKTVALKKVRLVNMDPESVRFMAREIFILRRLDHPNVVKLEGLLASRMSCSMYLVLEYMEHDLAGLIATPGIKFSEPQVKCYMQQLFSRLHHCHTHGVLHQDIKGSKSNLLIDNNGILKITDFGLATFFNPNQKQPLTSRVVTLWYRPPELLLGATAYGVSVDLWSIGCILAELLAGKPIIPGRTGKQSVQANPNRVSEKYNPQEDGRPRLSNGFLRANKAKNDEPRAVPSIRYFGTLTSSRVEKTNSIYVSSWKCWFSNLSGPIGAGSTSIKLDNYKDGTTALTSVQVIHPLDYKIQEMRPQGISYALGVN